MEKSLLPRPAPKTNLISRAYLLGADTRITKAIRTYLVLWAGQGSTSCACNLIIIKCNLIIVIIIIIPGAVGRAGLDKLRLQF